MDKEEFQGESSLGCLNCCSIKKLRRRAEKKQKLLKVVQLVLKPELFGGWTCLRARHVLGRDLSQQFRAGFVSGLDLSQGQTCPKTSRLEVSNSSRTGSVSWPEVSLGPTWFAAGSVLELARFIIGC